MIATINDIPRKARLRVESLPSRTVVWQGVVSKTWAYDLDEGKYVYKVHKSTGVGRRAICYTGAFLHGVTEEEFNKLQHIAPARASYRVTSDGPGYTCGFIGCNEQYGTSLAMVKHELEHQNLELKDLLGKPHEDIQETINEGHVIEAAAKREPGRTRKDVA